MEANAIVQMFEPLIDSLRESIKRDVLEDLRPMLERPYSVAEAAEALNMKESTLYYQIGANLIEIVDKPGTKKIPYHEVERLKGLR